MPQLRYIAAEPRPRSFLAQLIGFVVGLGILTVSIVLGAFLLAALLGFVLLVGLAAWVRIWWLRRRMRNAGEGAEFIDAEYTVVDTDRRDSRQR